MDKESLKKIVIAEVDKHRDVILQLGKKIYENPETGYKEYKTTEAVCDALKSLGLDVEENLAVTGCRARTNAQSKGPKIAIIGELDSVVCTDHPDCDEKTGAIHACGHNIQVTVMYGVAKALLSCNALEYLDGKIDFMAVPAEEYIELDYRQSLKEQGKITYFAGKPELIHKGHFDDVDMAMMVHNFPIAADGYKLSPKNTGNGFIGKKTLFQGKQSHAGAAPWDGINALNMATIAISNMHAQRETFKEADCVRIHQIINKGGDIVNAVPADVQLETTVRARNLEALQDANNKVNRSIHGAAIALGGKAVIIDSPGQMPLKADDNLATIFNNNALHFYNEHEILPCMESTASFDMGDLSLIMPVLHGITSGIEGGLHSKDYKIINEEDAYITPIKILCLSLIDLLFDGAKEANRVKSEFKAEMTKDEYLDILKKLEAKREY